MDVLSVDDIRCVACMPGLTFFHWTRRWTDGRAGDLGGVVCIGGVGWHGDVGLGEVCGTLVFGEGVGVAGRSLAGFGVAFGETGLGAACGVDLVVGLQVGGFFFAHVGLEVVDFFLEQLEQLSSIRFHVHRVGLVTNVEFGTHFSLDNFRSPTKGAGKRKSSITLDI